MEIIDSLEKTEYERSNGTFIGNFYWQQPYGLADYEEEWGRKWIDGVDYEFANSHPFYDKTGRTRPFEDREELNRRRLGAANSKAESTWNSVGYHIEKIIYEDAKNSSEKVEVDIKELSNLLYSLDEYY